MGIDLLEIDRLERALDRRPRLAERLFTDGERAYAPTRARPGDAPRRAVLREGGGREGARLCASGAGATSRCVGGGDAPPEVQPGRHGRRPRGRAGPQVSRLAHAYARDGGRGGGAEPMSLPRWLEPLLDAEQMRDTDAWAIESRGVPSLELMERAGEGLARGRRPVRAGRPRRGRLRQGQQRRRRARRRAAAAPGRARRRACCASGRREWLERRRGGDAAASCRGRSRSRSTPTRSGSRHVIVDAVLGTGLHRARRASRSTA